MEPFDLVIDAAAYAELGVTHVIAIAPITNVDEVQLELVTSAGTDEELGMRYLYRVTPP